MFKWGIIILLFLFSERLAAQTAADVPPPHIRKTLDSLKEENNLADWLYARIDYAYANRRQSLNFLMHSQKEAWRKAKSTPEREAWLMLLSNQGYNQLYCGNILESINCYEQAYNYVTDQKLNIADIAEYVLKPWANNYTRLGDYEKALFIQQKTLDFALKEHDEPLAVSTYNNMAISYRSIGDLKKALDYITQGLQKLNSLPGTAGSDLQILLDNTLADLYKDKNELAQAEKIITANIARQKRRNLDTQTAYWLLSSYITAGDIQLEQQHFNAARNYYQLGLKLNARYYKGNRLREQAYIITQLGRIKLSQHMGTAAIGYFNQNLEAFGLLNKDRSVNKDKIFGDNRLVDVFYQRAMAQLLLDNENEALANIRLALLAADKIRFELADVKTKQRFQSETKRMAEKAISIAFSLLEKTKKHRYAEIIVDIFEQTKARTLLDDIRRNQQQLTLQTKDPLFTEKQRLERAIAYNEKELLQDPEEIKSIAKNNGELKFKLEYAEKQLRAKYPSLGTIPTDLSFAGSLKRLPANAHIITFYVGNEYIYAIEIKQQRVKHIKRIGNAAMVKKRISDFSDRFYHAGPTAMMNNPKVFFNTSNEIYKTILGDFELSDHENLIIIPDEVLGYLSFDGLITSDQYTAAISSWPYLIKKATISYAFSIQTLINQSQKKKAANQDFSGLFITHQNSGKQFIPAVAKEAEALEKIVSGKFLKDEQASAAHFFEAFDHAAVLHISTHSFLSGAQKEPTLSFSDNQVFLFELSARKNAPSLVVLSACRTADGMIADGEGIISLSRGFAAIGTQGTIAGLWNVNDEAAAIITADTYQNMVSGQETAIALHQAKLNWLSGQQNGEQEYLPYYWDALIYMGYSQKIDLHPAGTPLYKYLLYGAVIIAVLSVIYLVLRPKRLKAGRLKR